MEFHINTVTLLELYNMVIGYDSFSEPSGGCTESRTTVRYGRSTVPRAWKREVV